MMASTGHWIEELFYSLALQVDGRMKADTKEKRGNVKQGKKRRLKGKQAKPTKQFNTNR